MKIEKKHLQVYLETYLQVYLEECKYKIKKKKLTNVIKAELQSGPEPELESYIELGLKS